MCPGILLLKAIKVTTFIILQTNISFSPFSYYQFDICLPISTKFYPVLFHFKSVLEFVVLFINYCCWIFSDLIETPEATKVAKIGLILVQWKIQSPLKIKQMQESSTSIEKLFILQLKSYLFYLTNEMVFKRENGDLLV